MYCTECGKENADNAIFCKYCGTRIADTANNQDSPKKHTTNSEESETNESGTYKSSAKNRNAIIFIAVLIIIIGGVLLGIQYYNTKRGESGIGTKNPSENALTVSTKIMNDIFQQLLLDCKASAPSPESWKEIKINEPVNKYIEVKSVPLVEGKITYLITGLEQPFLGARMPMYWIYEKTTAGYRQIADFGANDEVKILKSTHNGYRDIRTMGIVGAGTKVVLCKNIFNGNKYVDAGCKNQKLR